MRPKHLLLVTWLHGPTFAGLVVGRDGGSIAAGNVRIDVDKRFQINASNGYIKLLNLAKDDIVYIHFASASTSEEARTLTINNGVAEDPETLVSSINTDEKIAKITVSANGDMKITQSKGINFYQIFVNTDDTPTNINATLNDKREMTNDTVIYDLSGRRVDANYHGVVIMNGKKVVIKWEKRWACSSISKREQARAIAQDCEVRKTNYLELYI